MDDSAIKDITDLLSLQNGGKALGLGALSRSWPQPTFHRDPPDGKAAVLFNAGQWADVAGRVNSSPSNFAASSLPKQRKLSVWGQIGYQIDFGVYD
jgi:hypothetical protein